MSIKVSETHRRETGRTHGPRLMRFTVDLPMDEAAESG